MDAEMTISPLVPERRTGVRSLREDYMMRIPDGAGLLAAAAIGLTALAWAGLFGGEARAGNPGPATTVCCIYVIF